MATEKSADANIRRRTKHEKNSVALFAEWRDELERDVHVSVVERKAGQVTIAGYRSATSRS